MFVRVVVYVEAKREVLKVIGENRFEVKVKEPALQNLANERVRQILASRYQVNPKTVRLISGHHSSRKIFSLMDL